MDEKAIQKLEKVMGWLEDVQEILLHTSQEFWEIIRNARLESYGLEVGDELFFTDEFLALANTHRILSPDGFPLHFGKLANYREIDGKNTLIIRDLIQVHDVPVEVVQRMKQAAIIQSAEIR